MASSFRLRRFSSPATLKQIEPALLLRFLEPYRGFLSERGLRLPPEVEEIGYERLACILMAPDENTPDELLDALFFIDELAEDSLFDDIRDRAVEAGLTLEEPDDPSCADLAVRVWLADRNVLERLHAEQFLTRPKRFESFFSRRDTLPEVYEPSAETLAALEEDLNGWFDTHKKGRGTRVFPFFREDGVWFLVRHGQRLKREGTLERNGDTASIFYRPEQFDVMIYYPHEGELTIHTQTKGEREAYCRFLGHRLFGDSSFFDLESTTPKYTLAPLIENGREALCCSDVEGIQRILLTELQICHDLDEVGVEIYKANDALAFLEAIGRSLAPDARLARVSFKVWFAGENKPRTVTLRTPNIAIFDRESDNEIIHQWLAKRGFLCKRVEAVHAEPGEVLAVH